MKKITVLLFILAATLTHLAAQSKKNLFDLQRVHEIRLEFARKNWAEVMDSIRLYGNGLLEGNASIDGEKYNNVGVRYRGVRSFRVGNKRNALHIKLNYKNKDQNYQGHQKLKLSNALRDPSMVREVLGYEIARKYMIAPQAAYTRVYVNNEYYGLFVNVEAIDGNFLEKNFGTRDGVLVKCTPDLNQSQMEGCKKNIFCSLEEESKLDCYKNNYELKSKAGWNDLMNLTRILNKKPEEISKVLDVDQTLWMLAYNNVLVNLSSYTGQHSQNYYLYKNSRGKFVPILWDLNLAFGSYKNTGKGSDLSNKALAKLDPLLHADNPYKPLISQLLKNPMYKKTYLSHMRTILYDNFMDNGYEKRAKELQRLIYQAFHNDTNKYYTLGDFERSLYSTVGRRSKIPGIYSLMNKRAKYLKKNKNLKYIPPVVEDVSVLGRKKYSNERVNDFNILVRTSNKAKQVKVYYRFNSADDFQMAYLVDDGSGIDEKANDDIFGGTIASHGNEMIEYYVVAENPRSISFYPTNYMFELKKSSLKELNN